MRLPDRWLSVGEMQDYTIEQRRQAEAAADRQTLDAKTWEAENRALHGQLATDVQAAGFKLVLDTLVEDLQETGFTSQDMALRSLSWIPDNSEYTRTYPYQRLRAVYGYAVGFNSETWGIQGRAYGNAARYDHLESVFYMLGMATEDPNQQLSFQQLIRADQQDHFEYWEKPIVYGTFGGDRYELAIYRYEQIKDAQEGQDLQETLAGIGDQPARPQPFIQHSPYEYVNQLIFNNPNRPSDYESQIRPQYNYTADLEGLVPVATPASMAVLSHKVMDFVVQDATVHNILQQKIKRAV